MGFSANCISPNEHFNPIKQKTENVKYVRLQAVFPLDRITYIYSNSMQRTEPEVELKLKCYSQILCGRSAENFCYFVLIWWQTYKKQEILKQSCKDPFIWTELPIV